MMMSFCHVPLRQSAIADGQSSLDKESNPACHSRCWKDKVLLDGLQLVQEKVGVEKVLPFAVCLFLERDMLSEVIGDVLPKALPVAGCKGLGWRQPVIAQEDKRMRAGQISPSQTIYLPDAAVNAAQSLPGRQRVDTKVMRYLVVSVVGGIDGRYTPVDIHQYGKGLDLAGDNVAKDTQQGKDPQHG